MARKTMLGGGVRKAYASKGDDVTLSRFVKVPGGVRLPAKPLQGWLHGTRFNASVEGRSIFFNKGVKVVDAKPLVSGHSNVKIGRDVRKGKLFRGYWIYTLTLEERATCPRSCHHWDTCYGDHMPFAKRIDHTDESALYSSIRNQLKIELNRSGRAGVLVRLHALGDFFSIDYIKFWGELLIENPRLAVFGYTAWSKGEPMGDMIQAMKKMFGRRFSIRWSGNGPGTDRALAIVNAESCPPTAFVCPEQTYKTAACATCGLCWNTDKNVAFLEH